MSGKLIAAHELHHATGRHHNFNQKSHAWRSAAAAGGVDAPACRALPAGAGRVAARTGGAPKPVSTSPPPGVPRAGRYYLRT